MLLVLVDSNKEFTRTKCTATWITLMKFSGRQARQRDAEVLTSGAGAKRSRLCRTTPSNIHYIGIRVLCIFVLTGYKVQICWQ